MNPIEYLEQNGLNPDNFRTPAPPGSAPRDCQAQYYNTVPQVRRRKAYGFEIKKDFYKLATEKVLTNIQKQLF